MCDREAALTVSEIKAAGLPALCYVCAVVTAMVCVLCKWFTFLCQCVSVSIVY